MTVSYLIAAVTLRMKIFNNMNEHLITQKYFFVIRLRRLSCSRSDLASQVMHMNFV